MTYRRDPDDPTHGLTIEQLAGMNALRPAAWLIELSEKRGSVPRTICRRSADSIEIDTDRLKCKVRARWVREWMARCESRRAAMAKGIRV